MNNLPSVDELLKMAEHQPDELEKLRIMLCEQLIQGAPEEQRRKLRGLQFRIDMERRRAKTPLAACIAISDMMHKSFDELRNALQNTTRYTNHSRHTSSPDAIEHTTESQMPAKVLPFRRAKGIH